MAFSEDENGVSKRRSRVALWKIPYFEGKDREDIESYMNYLLNENEVLYSKFLIFFLSCTNQTKFFTRKEKEYNPHKSEKWLGSVMKKFATSNVKERDTPQIRPPPSEQQNSEVMLHIFLEEAHPHLTANTKLYSKWVNLDLEPLKS